MKVTVTMNCLRTLALGLGFVLAVAGSRVEASGEAAVIAVFDVEDTRVRQARLTLDALKSMRDYLANQLAQDGVFKVVPTSEIQAALRQGQAESYKACYDEACQIEIGKEIAAQKSLSTKISQFDTECVVSATLYDLRQTATDKAASAKGGCSQSEILVLMEKVAKKLRGGRAPTGVQGLRVKVKLESVPVGAQIVINDKEICAEGTIICEANLAPGSYLVKMEKIFYDSIAEVVAIKAEMAGGQKGTRIKDVEVRWQLVAQYGTVTFKTRPKGLGLSIKGLLLENPEKGIRLNPGRYRVDIADPCFEGGMVVKWVKNRRRKFTVPAKFKRRSISVRANNRKGRELSADVLIVDGRKENRAQKLESRQTPFKASMWVCAEEIRLSHPGYAEKVITLDRSNWPEKPINALLEGSHPFPWLPAVAMAAGAGLTSGGVASGALSSGDSVVSANDISRTAAPLLLWAGLTTLVGSTVWFLVKL